MTRIRDWIISWWRGADVSRQVAVVQRRIDAASLAAKTSAKRVAQSEIAVERKYRELEKAVERLRVRVSNAENTHKKLEAALDAATEDLKTANEILIPGLVSANRVLIDRWDSESAAYAVRAAAISSEARQYNG